MLGESITFVEDMIKDAQTPYRPEDPQDDRNRLHGKMGKGYAEEIKKTYKYARKIELKRPS